MEFEKYTERAKGFVQAAQTLALRSGHQRLTPDHLLKVLLDDKEGLAANLIGAAGGDAGEALRAVEAELAKLPRVEGQGAGQVFLAPETARLFEQAEQIAAKAGDSFVTVERLLLGLALTKDGEAVGPWNPKLDIDTLKRGLRIMMLTRVYDEALRPLGIQSSQLSVLVGAAMFGENGATFGALAKALHMDRTSHSGPLADLSRARCRRHR